MLRSSMMSALLVLLLAGCGDEPATAKQAEAPEVVPPADFVLQGIDGKPYHLADYRGKWVVVNYWATWCPPCLEEIPELIDFHDRHKDKDAVVLGVNYEEKASKDLVAFAGEYLMSYPVLLGEVGSGKNIGPIPGLPTTYVVSPAGEIVARQVGPLTGQMLDDFIAEQVQAGTK